jgi:DNA-directed RNA polymerase specialized sigma24 family protein
MTPVRKENRVESSNKRLDEIATHIEAIVDEAQRKGTEGSRFKCNLQTEKLFLRYHTAAYGYLLGGARDRDVADELCQRFAQRFLEGKYFQSWDPKRGRFRQYLKTCLYHLVCEYHREKGIKAIQLFEGIEPEAASTDGLIAFGLSDADPKQIGAFPPVEPRFRDAILARTWESLHAWQQKNKPKHNFYEILRSLESYPGATRQEMAQRLTVQLKPEKPYTDEVLRQTIVRARQKISELLLDEVANGLQDEFGRAPRFEELDEELIDLDLRRYVREDVLTKRKAEMSATE